MTKYMKLIVLSVVLLVLIALTTLAMIFDVDVVLFKNLSITTIQERELHADELLETLGKEELNNTNAKQSLETAKKSFEKEKETYENIDKSTIEIVEEANVEEKYFVEYLWVMLGGYAMDNNVDIGIVTAGTTVKEPTTGTDSNTNTNTNTGSSSTAPNSNRDTTISSDTPGLEQFGSSTGTSTGLSGSTTSSQKGLKVAVEGRYADVADFIFDVENDKSLRFKLDNIQMTYAGNNEIKAQFDVLSLAVLK